MSLELIKSVARDIGDSNWREFTQALVKHYQEHNTVKQNYQLDKFYLRDFKKESQSPMTESYCGLMEFKDTTHLFEIQVRFLKFGHASYKFDVLSVSMSQLTKQTISSPCICDSHSYFWNGCKCAASPGVKKQV